MICLIQLAINKAPSSIVALGLKIAVLGLALILFIKSELLCKRFAPLSNSKILKLSSYHNININILILIFHNKKLNCYYKTKLLIIILTSVL